MPVDDDLELVLLPSGAGYKVHRSEVMFLRTKVREYTSDLKFENVADKATLDQLIQQEHLHHRYSTYCSTGVDVYGDPIDEGKAQRMIKDLSAEIRHLRKSLSLDKASREAAGGKDTVAGFIDNLLVRAKEFGVNREEQLARALTLFNELMGRVTQMDNSTEEEQKRFGVTQEDIFEWLREEAFPAYEEIDEHFRQREDGQRMWIQAL